MNNLSFLKNLMKIIYSNNDVHESLFCLFVCLLRQGFSGQPQLSWNSLQCSVVLLSAGIKVCTTSAWSFFSFYTLLWSPCYNFHVNSGTGWLYLGVCANYRRPTGRALPGMLRVPCYWSQGHSTLSPILNKPMKRAKLMMKSRKGDLVNVTTLGRGIKIGDACPQLEFKGKRTDIPM